MRGAWLGLVSAYEQLPRGGIWNVAGVSHLFVRNRNGTARSDLVGGGGEEGEDSEMRGRRARRTERAAGGATLSDSAPVW